MNKNYWNEYKEQFVNRDIEIETLKFYQFSIGNNCLLKNRDFLMLAELDKMIIPDVYIQEIPIERLKQKIIKKIYKNFLAAIAPNKFHCLVLMLNGRICENLQGSFCFDIYNHRLLQINNKVINKNKMLILGFLDLKASIYIYEYSAFMEGVKEVNRLVDRALENILTIDHTISAIHQRASKLAGVNNRELLLVSVSEIRGK